MPIKLTNFSYRLSVRTILMGLWILGLFISHILLQVAAIGFILWSLNKWKSWRKALKYPLPAHMGLFFLAGLWGLLLAPFNSANAASIMPHLIIAAAIPFIYFNGEKIFFRRETLLNWLPGLATLTAMVGIWRHFQGVERAFGFYGGYFTLATLMAFTISLSAGYALASTGIRRKLILISLLLQTLALWYSYTRTAFLAVIAGMGLWFLFSLYRALREKNTLRIRPALWLLLPPVLLLILIFTSSDVRINPLAKPLPVQTAAPQQDFSSGRQSIWAAARRIITQDWQEKNWLPILLGYGARSRQRLIGNQYTSWESDYLQAYMNHGLLGLLIVIGVYFYFLKIAYRKFLSNHPTYQGIAIAALGFFLMSFLTLQLYSINAAGILGVIGLLFRSEK